ncbi:hypothetical protein [Diaphorobacter caeni]|uniref:hypothetical protein n=1 Tax=Diaphorobacter caeni TaxID=2784387 RepID=UPI00188E50AA|nr:hypothetical protein [Diaphorobacter caeni]MBF5006969.1 hypothetical protein [Diaphorobacter caeni]
MPGLNEPISRDAFRGLVQRNHAAGRLNDRPKQPQRRKVVQSGMFLMPDELARSQRLAAGEDRSVSSFMRRLYLEALTQYEAKQSGGAEQQ